MKMQRTRFEFTKKRISNICLKIREYRKSSVFGRRPRKDYQTNIRELLIVHLLTVLSTAFIYIIYYVTEGKRENFQRLAMKREMMMIESSKLVNLWFAYGKRRAI